MLLSARCMATEELTHYLKDRRCSTNLRRKTSATEGRSKAYKKYAPGDEVKIARNNAKVDAQLFSVNKKTVSLFTWFQTLSIEVLERMSKGQERQPPESILKTIDQNLTILEKLARSYRISSRMPSNIVVNT